MRDFPPPSTDEQSPGKQRHFYNQNTRLGAMFIHGSSRGVSVAVPLACFRGKNLGVLNSDRNASMELANLMYIVGFLVSWYIGDFHHVSSCEPS